MNGNRPGCLQRSVANEIPFGDHDTSFSHMVSLGVQRQLGARWRSSRTTSGPAGARKSSRPTSTCRYNPATGANYPFQDRRATPFPEWGVVRAEIMNQRSELPRMGEHVHQAVLEPVAGERHLYAGVVQGRGAEPVRRRPAARRADSRRSFTSSGFLWRRTSAAITLAATDQRHRATFNGIWDMGRGFQVSGLYFFGSGERFSTSWGGDLRNMGGRPRQHRTASGGRHARAAEQPGWRTDPSSRCPADEAAANRRAGAPSTACWRCSTCSTMRTMGRTTSESNASYGQPAFNNNVAFQPRIVQLGFRFAF